MSSENPFKEIFDRIGTIPIKSPAHEPADLYHYRVAYFDEEMQYISTCDEFPSLSAFGGTMPAALEQMALLVADVLEEMQERGETPPAPCSLREQIAQWLDAHPSWLGEIAAKDLRSGAWLTQSGRFTEEAHRG